MLIPSGPFFRIVAVGVVARDDHISVREAANWGGLHDAPKPNGVTAVFETRAIRLNDREVRYGPQAPVAHRCV
jgi:hypothetical protein